jgi:hypothetical protein
MMRSKRSQLHTDGKTPLAGWTSASQSRFARIWPAARPALECWAPRRPSSRKPKINIVRSPPRSRLENLVPPATMATVSAPVLWSLPEVVGPLLPHSARCLSSITREVTAQRLSMAASGFQVLPHQSHTVDCVRWEASPGQSFGCSGAAGRD